MPTRKFLAFLLIVLSSVKSGYLETESVLNNLNDECSRDIKLFEENLRSFQKWAVEIWESTGRPLSILRGNHYLIGDFDECVESSEGFKRQYCLVKITLKNVNPQKVYNNVADELLDQGGAIKLKRNELFWGWCGPASCTKNDIEIIMTDFPLLSELISPINLTYKVEFNENSCQTDQSNEPFTIGSILFISCSIFLIILALCSTTIHWYCEKINENTCPCIIKSFSIIENVEQLQVKDEPCLRMTYGLKTLAASYIICLHYFGTLLLGPVQNRLLTENLQKTWYGELAGQILTDFVDGFFALGGFFAVYSLNKRIWKKTFYEIIASRIMRILPLYAFIIFFIVTLLPETGSGPMWGMMMTEIGYCKKNWWTNLLFVNNYINSEEPCMANTWYVACDFHFYLLALVLCYYLLNPKKEITGLKIIGYLFISSILIPAMITYFMELPPTLYMNNLAAILPRTHETYHYVYIPTHNRMGPALLGILTGYLFIKWKNTETKKISAIKSTLIFYTALLMFLANVLILCLMFDMEPPYEPISSSIYAGLHRPINGFCVCVMVMICSFGYVPWIDHLLSTTPMIVLGKLTYGAYMISLTIQLRGEGVIRQSIYFTYGEMILTSFGYLLNSFVLSFLGYILIEAPVNRLFKLWLNRFEKGAELKIN